jgi:hypothetical protein
MRKIELGLTLAQVIALVKSMRPLATVATH